MGNESKGSGCFEIPDDLAEQVEDLSSRVGESPRFIVMAAVEHFFKISEEQRKAILRATALRRR